MRDKLDDVVMKSLTRTPALARALKRIPTPLLIVLALLALPPFLAIALVVGVVGRLLMLLHSFFRALWRALTTRRGRTAHFLLVLGTDLIWAVVFSASLFLLSIPLVVLITLLPPLRWVITGLLVVFLGLPFLAFRDMTFGKAFKEIGSLWGPAHDGSGARYVERLSPHLRAVRWLLPNRSVWSGWASPFLLVSMFFFLTWLGVCLEGILPGLFFTIPSPPVPFVDWLRLTADQLLRVIPIDILAPFVPSLVARGLGPTSPWGDLLLLLYQILLFGTLVAAVAMFYWHYRAIRASALEARRNREPGSRYAAVDGIVAEVTGEGALSDSETVIRMLELALAAQDDGRLQEAIGILHRAEEYALARDLLPERILILQHLSSIQGPMDAEAQGETLKVLISLAREAGDGVAWSAALCQAAMASHERADHAMALRQVQEAEWVARTYSSSAGALHAVLTQEWTLLTEAEELIPALRCATECCEMRGEGITDGDRAGSLRLRATTLLSLDRPTEALASLREEEALLEAHPENDLAYCLYMQSICHTAMESIPEATTTARRARELAGDSDPALLRALEEQLTLLKNL